MNQERKTGFYFVKYYYTWEIALWSINGYFTFCGLSKNFDEAEFEEIDERIIERQP